MALIDIKVPDIGDFDEVTVIELLVKPGDLVKLEQSLITVESDKASMEIPCSHAGVVKELKVKLGDKSQARLCGHGVGRRSNSLSRTGYNCCASNQCACCNTFTNRNFCTRCGQCA